MILEVRPGEGGDDAVLFANQLFKALLAYARKQGLPTQRQENGGRTLEAQIGGDPATLEPYTGVHRIQRCPPNDTRGRRHTSTATVAVLDQSSRITITVRDEDVEMHAYRGTGNGGQNRNKVATAVRLTHKPTGTVVASEEERTQWLNRQRAMGKLIKILTDQAAATLHGTANETRNGQIGSGERPKKEFTWNDQRGEVVDHGTGRRWQLRRALRGEM